MQEKKAVIIIGAGYTGLAAAYDLACAGHQVSIYEADAEIGGLAGSFELQPGIWIEKFYHHWFTSDSAILGLIRDLGIGDKIKFQGSNTGLFFANSIFRLSSPWDLLRFTPIPLIDRVRTGLMALYARRISDWKPLEDELAVDWIRRIGGKRAFDAIWDPLLKGKFGPEAPHVSAVWFWNKLKLRGSSRDQAGGESLAYLEGGFRSITEQLKTSLRELGIQIHLSSPVRQILSTNGAVKGIQTDTGIIEADTVLCTAPLPHFLSMTPALPADFRDRVSQIRFLGNVCLVLRLNRSLSDSYWLNVADPSFPFVGIIEHTNFDSKDHYAGEHIAYLSKYLPTSDSMYQMSEKELFEFSVPHIQKMFPDFNPSEWVIGYRAWKAEFSQPVITKNYSHLIPEVKTPIKGLWLSTMAQIYPEDRGTNYAVRHGRETAQKIIASLT
jgi:protoporphyrinogen oxidase